MKIGKKKNGSFRSGEGTDRLVGYQLRRQENTKYESNKFIISFWMFRLQVVFKIFVFI